jgi:hypothetical protein
MSHFQRRELVDQPKQKSTTPTMAPKRKRRNRPPIGKWPYRKNGQHNEVR